MYRALSGPTSSLVLSSKSVVAAGDGSEPEGRVLDGNVSTAKASLEIQLCALAAYQTEMVTA